MKDLLYLREKSLKEIIELIFQVYIDSYSDPHEVLKKNSFGRAHHRLLCIIEGNPNISIADILRKRISLFICHLKYYLCARCKNIAVSWMKVKLQHPSFDLLVIVEL